MIVTEQGIRFLTNNAASRSKELIRYINLKLAALNQPTSDSAADPYFLELAGPLLRNYHEKDRILGDHHCPVDARIQSFLDSYLAPVCPTGAPRLPVNTFVLDRPGLGRVMSLPPAGDTFSSPYLNSYRLPQGVLHNPASDRRTTKGIFHIVEGGLPVPADKYEVPKIAFARLLADAFRPTPDILTLPFTAGQPDCARLFVSLLMRPLVCPATATDPEKRMEIHFFAPGSLVSNLDFVEGIFGNAGDPYLPENDAALDVEHWTGNTGCVILAPHLVGRQKKDLGLPHYDEATARQRRDGMCWRDKNEIYNEGRAFKIACRDARGVMVTVIADNYYGYCKKEVKTQISFAANLYGLCEEEHAGGAIAFPSYVLGQDFFADRTVVLKKTTFEHAIALLGDRVDRQPGRYAIDKQYPEVFYVPENSEFNVRLGYVRWPYEGATKELPLRETGVYVLPSGYRVRLEKQMGGTAWRLVGTRPNGTLCHKPSTVSGGGKSEISKSLSNTILKGPIFVRDYQHDMDQVAEIFKKDFTAIFQCPTDPQRAGRPILSLDRSLGSVIKLMTPSPDYTSEYNDWLHSLPQILRQLVFSVKRYYQPDWGDNWREHFTVDRINGYLGHELRYDSQKLVGNYLRVGYDPGGAWRIYKLRPDFKPAEKVQVEDDITVSVVVPRERLPYLGLNCPNPSVKLVQNCEALLFQRPDDAIHRGADRQAEADIASPGTFLSNFQPLTRDDAKALVEHVVEFDEYTEPMKRLLKDFAEASEPAFVVSSAHPRIVDGAPSKNPRYLEKRPDLVNPRESWLAEIGGRLDQEIPADAGVYFPVSAVLSGRRNNPPEPKIGLAPLAVYNPIHYQELPELFMDLLSSLTGKSPSTTGFGSEGALTKGPFNALLPVYDLNNALVSFVLTGYNGFTTAAGHLGPKYRIDHDISMLVPEIWCRMKVSERDAQVLIDNGYMEKVADFEYEGRTVLASRLGYRITALFGDHYLGRIFEAPDTVLTEELLRPEKQDLACFVSGVESIVEAQQRVAQSYFEDGSIDAACPPLKALLHILAHGDYEGLTANDPAFRALFTRESVLASDWYRNRLRTKQQRDIALWKRHVAAVEAAGNLPERVAKAQAQLARVSAASYLDELVGTIGADPLGPSL
ncbi:MAG: hypothetical protein ABI693_17520 [Bryobacteraceae bacterium]